jgi:hypothetical protein
LKEDNRALLTSYEGTHNREKMDNGHWALTHSESQCKRKGGKEKGRGGERERDSEEEEEGEEEREMEIGKKREGRRGREGGIGEEE